jgi:TolB-like protein/tRNA A-37 threonylcarbamoyl transferase component Bud32
MPEIPDRLRSALADRYRLDRQVGQGGMATVYLAEDLKHGRRVALKVLRPELAAALGHERFVREIEIAAQLQHPHILPLFDSGEAEGFLYYVMPFVDGESLRDRLTREGGIPIPEAVRILREVVDALAHAHQHGVVHRDIKPDNVMLSGRHAVVTDFGVAKAVSAAGSDKLTTVGMALGTPTYMSPEQAMGETNLDQRADIYSVGALAYELFTGHPPFEKATPQQLLSAHVLEKPAEQRWQTAEAMLEPLELAGTPSGGITPTSTRPLPATARPRPGRRWYGAGAVGMLMLAAGGGWFVFGRQEGSGRIEQVAVLPFQDLSGKDKVFVDAMHDALIGALVRQSVVGIVSRNEVMRFRDGGGTTADIAKALHADAVMETTVFRDGDRMRINAQLVEPVTLRYVWSQTYERDVKDVLGAQRELVDAISADLAGTLSGKAIAARTSEVSAP